MKQKGFWMLGLLLSFYSCSELEELPIDLTSNVVTRTPGDGLNDALGYGYDITDEYLGEKSTKLRILDVAKFVKDNPDRYDNPFIGIIDQRVFAGEDAISFLKQLITDTNFNNSIASVGKDAKADSGFFSATITTGFKSNTKYSYSSKYSFAKAEVFKKQRKYLLNSDIQTLSKYLSLSFTEDLDKYSADKIVEMYGTHVLTNITVGGVYTAYYKSSIIEEDNHIEKTNTVSAGVKFNTSKIGLDSNGSWSSTEITEKNKKNSNWECYVKCLGGSTSGTSYTINPNQGTTVTINLGDWTKSVDDKNSRLVDVDWNATYPIYELISDPIKKQEIKDAVLRYIDSKKIEILSLRPMFEMYSPSMRDRYYVFKWSDVLKEINEWGAEYRWFDGYILENPIENTNPMYEMYDPKTRDRYYVFSWEAVLREVNEWGAEYRWHDGYILTVPTENKKPMYEMFDPYTKDRYFVFSWNDVVSGVNEWGAEYRWHDGYIFN